MIHVDFKVKVQDLGKLVWLLDTGAIKVFDFTQRAVKQAVPQKNGKVVSTVAAGSAAERIANELHTLKVRTISTSEFKSLIGGHGLAENSYSHFIHKLVKARVLKATKQKGMYTVLA